MCADEKCENGGGGGVGEEVAESTKKTDEGVGWVVEEDESAGCG